MRWMNLHQLLMYKIHLDTKYTKLHRLLLNMYYMDKVYTRVALFYRCMFQLNMAGKLNHLNMFQLNTIYN